MVLDGTAVAGTYGILFNSGGNLIVRDSVIRNFTGRGIQFSPNGPSNLAVSNTLVADNGGRGIIVVPSGLADVKAIFNRVEVNNNTVAGITVDGSSTSGGTIYATVMDSVAHANGGAGFIVNSGSAIASLGLFRSVSSGNDTGIATDGTGHLFLGQSAVVGNTNNASFGSGLIFTFGDNYQAYNASTMNNFSPQNTF